jgi:hypothetical protein
MTRKKLLLIVGLGVAVLICLHPEWFGQIAGGVAF